MCPDAERRASDVGQHSGDRWRSNLSRSPAGLWQRQTPRADELVEHKLQLVLPVRSPTVGRCPRRARGSADRTERRPAPTGSGDPPRSGSASGRHNQTQRSGRASTLRCIRPAGAPCASIHGQIVWAMVFCVTAGLIAPGVVDASGSELCARAPLADRVTRTKIAAALDHIRRVPVIAEASPQNLLGMSLTCCTGSSWTRMSSYRLSGAGTAPAVSSLMGWLTDCGSRR